jgi:cytochrome c oxidase subunit IV
MTNGAPDTRGLWRGPVLAWIALIALFAINLGTSYVTLGVGNSAINLSIAALMVITLAFFLMDLRNSTILIRLVAVAGLFWMIMMFALTFSDYLSRD